MSSACAGCGSCCDPVVLAADVYARCLTEPLATDSGEFIARHWHPAESYADAVGTQWLRLRCDMLDPASRRCTAYQDRPPVCSGYPWYGRRPNEADATFMPPECSYLAELPPKQRPAGARPLLPLTVLSHAPA